MSSGNTLNRVWCMITAIALTAMLGASASAMSRVRDEGKFFSADTVQKAEQALNETWEKQGKLIIVQTYDAAPPALAQRLAGGDVARMMGQYAQEQAAAEAADFYLLICRRPSHLRLVQRDQAGFSTSARNQIAGDLVASFNQRQYDRGLLHAIDQMRRALGATSGNAPPSSDAPAAAFSSGSGIGSLLCVGVVTLGILMVILSLLRNVFNARRTALPPHLGGLNDPNQPGGSTSSDRGGAFGRGLAGGMIGGIIGGWLGNQAFGQSRNDDLSNDPDAPTTDTPDSGGDFGDTYSDSGGDFGGD